MIVIFITIDFFKLHFSTINSKIKHSEIEWLFLINNIQLKIYFPFNKISVISGQTPAIEKLYI